MKKKVYSLLTTIFLLFACVIASACGNKYENLEFKIYYAFSADATESEWIDASNGISLNYRSEDGSLVFEGQDKGDESGTIKLYFKVAVANVKEKYVDLITVSATSISGMNFSSVSVSQNEVFAIDITGNVNTKLKFYENNSRKQADVDFVVSRCLDSIEVDTSMKPAVLVDSEMALSGESMNFNSLNNLIFKPINKTNQTAVSYSIEAVGGYDSENKFVPSTGDGFVKESENLVTIDGVLVVSINESTLTVGPSFKVTDKSYIIQIKATSKFNEKISAVFDVYVVGDNKGAVPTITYGDEDYDATKNNNVSELTLYAESQNYSNVDIKTNLSINNVYMNNILNTSDGTIQYKPYFYVDGEKYPLDQQGVIKSGLIIEDLGDGKFNAKLAQSDIGIVDVKIIYELEDFDFTASYRNGETGANAGERGRYSATLSVKKSVLPNAITVNNVDYDADNSPSQDIYSVSNEGYLGYKMTVKSTPSESNDEVIGISKNSNVIITDYKGKEIDDVLDGYYQIKSGSTVYVKFKDSSEDSAVLTFRTRNNPKTFKGVDNLGATYVQFDYEFKKIVTANELIVYSDETCETELSSILYVSETATNIYVKAYHDAGMLQSSSISGKSSNSAIVFGTGAGEILFSGLEQKSGIDEEGQYVRFTVPIKSISALKKSNITFTAGDTGVKVNASLVAESVKVMSSTAKEGINISINSGKNYVRDLTNQVNIEKTFNFAIVKNQLVELSVLDANNSESYINSISLTAEENGSAVDYNIIPTNGIGIRGKTSNTTAKFKLVVSYYYETSGVVKEESSEYVIEFAVYEAISNISTTLSKNEICYVNFFEEAGTTDFTFKSYSSPSSSVKFGETTISGASQIQVVFSENITDLPIEVRFIADRVDAKVSNNQILHFGEGEEATDYLNGKIKIKLTGNIEEFRDFNITLKSLSFSKEIGVQTSTTIKIVKIETAERISASTDLLDLSFMDADDGETISKSVDVQVEYSSTNVENGKMRFDDLTYMLYEYDKISESGEIEDENEYQATNRITIQISKVANEKYRVTASSVKGVEGGIFRLVIATKDSFKDGNYKNSFVINVRVCDGDKIAYQIYDESDLMKINNDLQANYALENNIVILSTDFRPLGLINGVVNTFKGEFYGNNKSITLSLGGVANAESDEYGALYGLFAILEGEVSDLIIHATFADFSSSHSKGLKVGTLAGVNKGIIKNVLVNISGSVNLSSSVTIDFGGIVGLNNGEIKLENLGVNMDNVNICSTYTGMHNIGGVAGTNAGTISGNYEGKSSLNNIVFNIISTLTIENQAATATYYVGGVAGTNTYSISGLLLGGKIEIKDKESGGAITYSASGYLAGIAGNASGSISTCASLGLDLIASAKQVAVAGAVGTSSSSTLTDVRFISAHLKEYDTYGMLKGCAVIAGVVANASGDTLTNVTVENFIDKVNNVQFFTFVGLADTVEIYGVAKGSATISQSFVRANIDACDGKVWVVSDCENTDTYFIGRVNNCNNDNLTKISTYSVIYNDVNIFYSYKHDGGNGSGDVFEYPVANDVTAENFAEKVANGLYTDDYVMLGDDAEYNSEKNYYTINLLKSEFGFLVGSEDEDWNIKENVNTVSIANYAQDFYFPYIVKQIDDEDGTIIDEAIMIIAPTDLSGVLNEDGIVGIGSIYIEDYEETENEIDFTETALINFYYKGNNTYTITDLVDLTILPDGATGGVRYEIVGSGYKYAHVTNDEITFNGISWNTPIIVKAYSVFDVERFEYFAFYTQAGFTELEFNSSSLLTKVESEDYDYVLSISTGESVTLLEFSARNEKKGKNYDSLLDSVGIEQYLNLEVSGATKLTIDASSIKNISLRVKDEVSENTEEIITFTLQLSKTYFGIESEEYFDIGEIKLLVKIFSSATDLEIAGGDHDIATDGTVKLSATLETGFVNTTQTGAMLEETEDQIKNGELYLDNSSKDNIRISFTCNDEASQEELETLMVNANVEAIVKLFDFTIVSSPIKLGDKTTGYSYSITFSLKDQYEYRYIKNQINLTIHLTALSNPGVSDSVLITLMPTKVSTVRIENYTVNSINVSSNYTNLIEANNVESVIISPGGKGSVMMIYVEKSYAHFDEITLSTSNLYVPSLGKDVSLKFTQLYYDKDAGKYVTLTGSDRNLQDGNTLKLSRISYADDGKEYFDGIIYVHAQLEKFSGLESTIKATLNVKTDGVDVVQPCVKSLLTSYLPGVYLSSDALELQGEDNEFLVQEVSFNNSATIKAYGYEFNSNPTVQFVWSIEDGSNYFYNGIDGEELIEENFNSAINNGNTVWYKKEGKFYQTTTFDTEIATTYYVVSTADMGTICLVSEYDNPLKTYKIGDFITHKIDENVAYNAGDNSYSINVMFDVKNCAGEAIPTSFKMLASLTLITTEGQIYSSEKASLTFHPTDYIVKDVTIGGLNNGVKRININQSTVFELEFETGNDFNLETSNAIYEKLTDVASKFYYIKNGATVKFSDDISMHPEFDVYLYNGKVSIVGNAKFEGTIYFASTISYVLDETTGKYVLQFGEVENSVISQNIQTSFTLKILAGDTQENAIPIWSASDMFNADGTTILGEGQHYILMNDIVLDMAINPIDVPIGSFDGNNRVITITEFLVDPERTEYGLFANISTYENSETELTTQTILKNVMVDYGSYNGNILSLVNNEITDITFGGLVAKNNGGLIYNCDVINLNASINKEINILVDNSTAVNVTFGGLVGINANNGVITNSRVGRSSYTRIEASLISQTDFTKSLGSLTFKILNSIEEGNTANQFNIVAGGFVGENSGIIASSYIANTSLINYSTAGAVPGSENKTAGFAGSNVGTISYSYVKAEEDTISRGDPYSTDAQIENLGNGIVAGFVYDNSGTISDSFANTELKTKSAYIAGFVYSNSGSVTESYAACKMNIDVEEIAKDKAEQPFIGMDTSGKYLNSGTFDNVYYLEIGADTNSVTGVQGLDLSNFQEQNNLSGFVFIDSNVKSERDQGSWSYYTLNGQYHSLPELNNANMIAHSYKYLRSEENLTYHYTNARNFESGTYNNPHTISNVNEYNNVFAQDGATTMTGYARLINNIDFEDDKTAIKTRINFTLGDSENSRTITSIDGNGMTISGIYLDIAQGEIVDSVGLFSKIENSYVKNINLEFATPGEETDYQFSTTTAMYSGGLAGRIKDSVIINVNLNGESTTLTGNNFVGGLAGMISGGSLIYGIESNLYVKTGESNLNPDVNGRIPDYMYFNESDYLGTMKYEDYLKEMSFAGGIAGVIDVSNRNGIDYNLSFISVRGDEMSQKTRNSKQEANILADYAGGVAGYANKNTSALRLKYFVGTNELIRGDKAAGGLFGVYLGSLTASQVTAEEETQYNYDTALGQYIIDLEDGKDVSKTDFSNSETFGNLNLIESYNYAGGLIGVGAGAHITASYSKAGIKSGVHVGGLIGASMASSITYSYAVPFVNLTSDMKYVGGLIGSAYATRPGDLSRNDVVSTFEDIVKSNGKTNNDTDIQFTFSTLLLNNSALATKTIEGEGEEAKEVWVKNFDSLTIDYICANYQDSLTSNRTSQLTYVFAGLVNYQQFGVPAQNIVTHSTAERALSVDLYMLYDLDNNDHEMIFLEVFSTWSVIKYWSLNSDKYFPLLNDENVENYILIRDADDFKYLIANPDGNFKIVNDIEYSDYSGNWVFNVNFTGTLIGEIEGTDRKPNVTGLHVVCDLNNTTAGLFKSTEYATISNINFVWNGLANDNKGTIDLNSKSGITYIGGLSCQDTGSLFSAVDVTVAETNENGYLIGTSATSATIQGFGGLVGEAINSNIMGCTFSGNANVNLIGSEVFFGGIVGQASRMEVVDEDDVYSSSANMLIMNSSVGLDQNSSDNQAKTNFKVTIDISTNDAYVGIAVGEAIETSISGVTVAGANYVGDYQTVDLEIVHNAGNLYAGGFIGKAKDSTIVKCDANNTIALTGAVSGSEQVYLGGFVGNYELSADATDLGIRQANVWSKISVGTEITGYSAKNLVVSAGLAKITGNIELKQSLFHGEITFDETSPNSITTVTAGGAAGIVQDKLSIQEVFSDVVMTIGSNETENIYAGGLVGSAKKLNILDSATSGRIIPITKYESNNDEIYIGGFVGKVTDELNVTNAYSASSIITDGLAGKALTNLYKEQNFNGNKKELSTINALIGYASVDTEIGATINLDLENAIYSSDVALCTEEHGVGKNYNAYTFYFNPGWKTSFIVSGVWKEIASGGLNCLPAITSLVSTMKTLSILDTNGVYVTGSALKPENSISDLTLDADNDDYKYYLLSASASGTLNGILIGNDAHAFNSALSLPSISEHSVVSNIHVKLGTSSQVNLTDENNNGIIANVNKGVIFNCSVQGSNLTVSGVYFGLIAGNNSGLVSHCYSTAEITSTTSDSLGGIVSQNSGKIYSCYFTGYIDNGEDNSAAGIVNYKTLVPDTSYLYNNYMAGVITSIGEGRNSLTGNVCSTEGNDYGSNNFIDSLASVDVNENEDGKIDHSIELVQTASLMANASLLKGQWHTTALLKDAADSSKGYVISTEALGFGLNFCYPAFNFGKVDNEDKLIDLNYQENTGNGSFTTEDKTKTNWNEKLTERAEAILNGGSGDYVTAFKVPHLGVLTAIQGITQTKIVVEDNGEQKEVTPSLNFVLIHDVNIEKFDLWEDGWTSIGSSDVVNGFAGVKKFTGVFVSNKGMTWLTTEDTYNELTDESKENATFKYAGEEIKNISETYCLISNLKKKGLFTNISDVFLGYMNLGNFVNIDNSGPLGTTVNGNTVVKEINYVEESVLTGQNKFSALFGEINDGTMKLISFSTTKLEGIKLIPTVNISGSSGSTFGLIAGTMLTYKEGTYESKPTIEIDGSIYEDGHELAGLFKNNIYIAVKNCDVIGGVVGEIIGCGNINGNGVSISFAGFEECVNVLGGIVGKIELSEDASEVSQIKNLTVNLCGSNNTMNIYANTFGGLVGVAETGATFNACSIISTGDDKLTVYGTTSDNRYYGMIAGRFGKAGETDKPTLTVDAFKLVGIKSFTYQFDEDGKIDNLSETNTAQAIGTFVGYQNGNLVVNFAKANTEDGKTEDNMFRLNNPIQMEVIGLVNLGGFAGYFEGGSVAVEDTEKVLVTLIGKFNVGGMFGYATALPNDVTDVVFEIIDYTDENGDEFASIIVGDQTEKTEAELEEQEDADKYLNIGGLFGILASDSFGVSDETFIFNNNTISIGLNATVYNVGGIAGKFIGQGATNLINKGEIKGNENAFSSDFINNRENDTENPNVYGKIINVGGVFGTVILNAAETGSSPKISNISSMAPNIQGYQNVGGLIGYVSGKVTISNLTGEETTLVMADSNLPDMEFLGTPISGNVTGVINVGGAVGYLGEEAIIENVRTTASVSGNANVGGLVGYAKNVEINNTFIGSTEASEQEVKGLIYQYIYFLENEAGEKLPFGHTFIPTSVGGLVGTANNSEITNNILNAVIVTSADESQTVISTISNEMVNIPVGLGGSLNSADIIELVDQDNEINLKSPGANIKFANVKTGYGGFIGTVDSNTLSKMDAKLEGGKITTVNYMKDIKINAQLGINVGTFYGYYQFANNPANLEGQNYPLVTPALYGTSEIKIDGAYNVGGLVGFFDVGVSGASDQIASISNTLLSGSATIILQNELSGINVGGLFGILKSNNVSNINLQTYQNIDIIISTQKSYYIGGLVGKLIVTQSNIFEGSLGVYSSDDNGILSPLEGTAKVTTSEVKDVESSINFGGLIGLLKVDSYSSSSGLQIVVNGNHPYAFTINTIENGNYFDGESTFNYTASTTVDLYAQAYYINLDTFSIQGTSDSSWYAVDARSPLNKDVKGWAKEYTGFKTIQRCIPQENVWDSIATIYDASYIWHVGTIANLGIDISGDIKPQHYGQKSDGSFGMIDCTNDYICFTVYGEDKYNPILYSAIGVATVQTEAETGANGAISSKYAQLKDQTANFGDYCWGALAGQSPQNICYIDMNQGTLEAFDDRVTQEQIDKRDQINKNAKALSYYTWTLNGNEYCNYQTLNGEFVSYYNWNGGANQNFVSYFVEDFLSGDADLPSRVKYTGTNANITKKGVFFVFDTVYQNASSNGYHYEGGAKVSGADDTQLPSSGSVFEVCGFQSGALRKAINNENSTDWWGFSWTVVDWVITIASVIITGGTAIGAVAAKKALTKAIIHKCFKEFAEQALKKSIIKVVVAGAGLALSTTITCFTTSNYVRNVTTQNIFLEQTDQNFGLLGLGYSRVITYKEGVAQGMQDSIYEDEYGAEFIFYSFVRPNDYHQNEYVGIPIQSTTASNFKANLGDCEFENGSRIVISENNSEKIAISLSSIDIDSYAKVYAVVNDSTIANKFILAKSGGQIYILYNYYIYKDGAYWINSNAGEVDEMNTSGFFKEPDSENWFVNKDGQYYIYGQYNGEANGYKFVSGRMGNHVLGSEGNYSLNGVSKSDSEIETIATLKYSYRSDFSPTTGGLEGDGYTKELGYDYFQGAYYTANSLFRDSNLVRYAKFTKLTSKPADYEDYKGIQYLSYRFRWYVESPRYDGDGEPVLDADGNQVMDEIQKSETVYYAISSISLTKDGLEFVDRSQVNLNQSTPSELCINIYPYSFDNPYKSTITNSQDNNYYESNPLASETATNVITHVVEYYLFDGGYIYDDGKVFVISDLYNQTSGENKIPLIKKEDGSIVSKSFDELESLLNNGSERDKYLYDGELIYEIFRFDDEGNMYMLDKNYKVGEDGYLKYLYLIFGEDNKYNYNYGKYLSNFEHLLFTRYKYIYEGRISDLSNSPLGLAGWVNVDLIPSNALHSGSPNTLITTFTERVKVTLSGNRKITQYNKGVGILEEVISGQIIIR